MSKKSWSVENLQEAIQAIKEKKLSIRAASCAYGVPRSTLHDYLVGRVEIGCKRGPDSILTTAEEQCLVSYALHMAEIGYGRSRDQITAAVRKIIEKDHRPNPFRNNTPGRKWWALFKKRHPEICLRSPEHLQLCRIKCCTTEAIMDWFFDFDQFLQRHEVKDKPTRIWNADESGFSLCPKTGKVIAMKNTRNVYAVTGDSKEQITTLCVANAAGDVLPPMY